MKVIHNQQVSVNFIKYFDFNFDIYMKFFEMVTPNLLNLPNNSIYRVKMLNIASMHPMMSIKITAHSFNFQRISKI